ncbi:MAG: flavodoxin family protein [Eubacteriales bacterium]|nr:flavodoxin family protein [Eubacteriales bacterium]
MSILVIWASPNQDGLTAAAKNRVMDGIAAGGGEASEIPLNQHRIHSCRACGNGWGTCRSDGSCVIEDDFAAIYDRLIAADGIVWVTPVYWHDMAENLKTFLDRLRRCEAAHNHHLQGKRCLLVACAGGSGNGAVACLQHMEVTLAGHMKMVPVERLPVTRFNRAYLLPALHAAGEEFAKLLGQG